jgi:hypothetical protein
MRGVSAVEFELVTRPRSDPHHMLRSKNETAKRCEETL